MFKIFDDFIATLDNSTQLTNFDYSQILNCCGKSFLDTIPKIENAELKYKFYKIYSPSNSKFALNENSYVTLKQDSKILKHIKISSEIEKKYTLKENRKASKKKKRKKSLTLLNNNLTKKDDVLHKLKKLSSTLDCHIKNVNGHYNKL